MADRIVYVCGCGTIGAIEINGSLPNYVKSRSWRKSDCGYVCHQPVTAVNLDRLLRLEARVPVVCDECGGRGEVADTSKTDHPHGLVGYTNKPCPTCHGTGAVWKQTVQKEGK